MLHCQICTKMVFKKDWHSPTQPTLGSALQALNTNNICALQVSIKLRNIALLAEYKLQTQILGPSDSIKGPRILHSNLSYALSSNQLVLE